MSGAVGTAPALVINGPMCPCLPQKSRSLALSNTEYAGTPAHGTRRGDSVAHVAASQSLPTRRGCWGGKQGNALTNPASSWGVALLIQ